MSLYYGLGFTSIQARIAVWDRTAFEYTNSEKNKPCEMNHQWPVDSSGVKRDAPLLSFQ